jgi:TolA-binding protein
MTMVISSERSLSTIALFALILAAACGSPAPPDTAPAAPDAPVRLGAGPEELSARLPQPVPAAAQLLSEAQALFDGGSWRRAAERFALFTLRHRDDPQAVHAVHFLGLSQEKLDDIEGMIEAFDFQLANFPTADEESTCEAIFKTAECHYRRGRNGEAESRFRRIIAEHPRSRWAEWARERVAMLSKIRTDSNPCCG